MIRRRRRGGTLHIIAGLMIASAFVRIGTEAQPAIAQQMAAEAVAAPEDMAVSPMPADEDSLLAALQSRERRLEENEAQLRERMAALREAEAELEQKLTALIAAETQLSATIAQADSAAETDINQLKTVYENMKPKEAAALFAEMPPQFAAGFLGMMRPDAAAAIMTELEPEVAYSFSVVLAGRNATVPTE